MLMQEGQRVRSLINFGSFGIMRIKKGQVLTVVSANPRHVEITDDGEARICFLAREVEPMPLTRFAIQDGGKRFWRVSAFALDNSDLKSRCLVHHASRNVERAEAHYLKLCKDIGTKYSVVVLHQGNLKRAAYKIHARLDAAPAAGKAL